MENVNEDQSTAKSSGRGRGRGQRRRGAKKKETPSVPQESAPPAALEEQERPTGRAAGGGGRGGGGNKSWRSNAKPGAMETNGGDDARTDAPSSEQRTNATRDKRNAKQKQRNQNNNKNISDKDKKVPFASHWDYSDCLALYANKQLVRGKLRVLPQKNGKAFVTSDRGDFAKDVLIETPLHQNRALDGDVVFVELFPPEQDKNSSIEDSETMTNDLSNTAISAPPITTWQEDTDQRRLWNPQVDICKVPDAPRRFGKSVTSEAATTTTLQRKGQVVHVVFPKPLPSELQPADESFRQRAPRRTIVGRLNRMKRKNGDILFLQPNNKSLPQFVVSTKRDSHETRRTRVFVQSRTCIWIVERGRYETSLYQCRENGHVVQCRG